MKLTFRTIKGTTFNLDAEPSTSVGDLKAAVETAQGASTMPKDQIKLVYKGKVLEDNSKAISEYNVDESGFLVVFVQKKTEPKPAAAAGGASSSQPAAAAEVGLCAHRNLLLVIINKFRPDLKTKQQLILQAVTVTSQVAVQPMVYNSPWVAGAICEFLHMTQDTHSQAYLLPSCVMHVSRPTHPPPCKWTRLQPLLQQRAPQHQLQQRRHQQPRQQRSQTTRTLQLLATCCQAQHWSRQ